ncbi:HD family phosphohydrolase [Candidatus Palauibacter sp.]|uniref:HD family phosphohydrolase n=1 Tax=Candidatus Palauibacter sp. TaxID=3101350 RepID=UPI003B01C4E3
MSLYRRVRDYLRPVNRPPAGGPKDAWVHHGFRVGVVIVIALAVPWLFPRTSLPEFDGIVPGSVARQTINATFDFDVPKDPDRLLQQQDEAEAAVTPTLRFEPARADSSIERVNSFFARLDTALAAAEAQAAEEDLGPAGTASLIRTGVEAAAGEIGIDASVGASGDSLVIDHLLDSEARAQLQDEVDTAFQGLREGVIRESELADINSVNVVVREEPGGEDQVRRIDELVRLGDFSREAREGIGDRLPPEGAMLFQRLMLQAQPTLRIDQDATRQDRERARSLIPQVEGSVLEGERIITENTRVTEESYRRLLAYERQLIERGEAGTGTGFLHSLGMVLLVVAMLGILVFATYRFRRGIYEDLRSFSVLLGLILLVMSAAGVVAATESSPALVPVALAGLLAAALFDSLLGLIVVSTITGILMGQPHFAGLAAPMVTVAGGVTAAFAVSVIHTRSQSWILIALIAASYVGAGILLNFTGHYGFNDLGTTAAFGALNATLCTGLGMGVGLPLLEVFTGRTTEQSLLELSDMNRPLLRRLAREAPGTYAHSINVANLAEAACEAIGANALLGRVGVYYHDIGKLERPQYFIENQPKGLNPHDRLSPWQSAEILRDHVRAGLRMADEARLPEVVKDFIREHHGTQPIRYFLEKARSQDGAADVDPNDFAYPGPKPRSRETGVAMLGDATEAASRVLTNPSPERIRALIDRLFKDRIDHGELDDCQLTYRDLRIVKREFARVLTGLYHHRIDYPTPVVPEAGGREPTEPPRPETAAGPEEADAAPESEGQLSIDLEQAAQGDTGPIPPLDPVPSADERAD